MSLGTLKNIINKMCLQIMYLIYMNKEDLAFIFTNPSARAGYDTRSIFLSGV